MDNNDNFTGSSAGLRPYPLAVTPDDGQDLFGDAPDTEAVLRARLMDAQAYDPAAYSKSMDVASQMRLEPDQVYGNEDIPFLQTDFKGLLADAPRTSRFLSESDPSPARAMRDKLDALAKIEQRDYRIGSRLPADQGFFGSFAQNANDIGESLSESQRSVDVNNIRWRQIKDEMNGTLTVTPQEAAYADSYESTDIDALGTGGLLSTAAIYGANVVPQLGDVLERAPENVLTMAALGAARGSVIPEIGTAAGALSGFGAGMTASYLESSFVQETASAYGSFIKYRDENGQPLDKRTAIVAAMAAGLSTAALDYASFGKLLKVLPFDIQLLRPLKDAISEQSIKAALKNPAAKAVIESLSQKLFSGAKAVAFEGVTEGAQQGIQDITGEAAKALQGGFEPISKAAFLEDVSASARAGFYSALLPGFSGAAVAGGKAVFARKKPITPTLAAENIAGLNKAVRDSGLSEERPEAFARFAQSLDDGKMFYVDSKALEDFVGTLAPEAQTRLEQSIPDLYGRLSDAQASGAPVAFKTAEYLKSFAGLENADALAPHIKADPNDFTQAEQQAFASFVTENGDLVAKTSELLASPSATDETVAATEAAIKAALVGSGRTQDEASSAAPVMARILSRAAAPFGETAAQSWLSQGVTFEAQGDSGAVARQATNFAAAIKGARALTDGKKVGAKRKVIAEALKTRLDAAGLSLDQAEAMKADELSKALSQSESLRTTQPSGYAKPSLSLDQSDGLADGDTIKFRRKLEQLDRGEVQPNQVLQIGTAPDVLTSLGGVEGKLTISPSVIQKIEGGKHAVERTVTQRLKSLLSNPIAVFASATKDGDMVVVIEAKDKNGADIVVPVRISPSRGGSYVITSVYGKGDKDWFRRQVDAGRLRYVNTEKAPSLFDLPITNITGRTGQKPETSLLTEKDFVKENQTLSQRSRASISLDALGNVLFSFTKRANFSSTIHEFSHWAVLLHGQAIERMRTDPSSIKDQVEAKRMQEDWERLKSFVGATSDTLTTDQHETIAAGFEAYMREGKAPSKELAPVFSRFMDWLLAIYKDAKEIVGFGGLDDEVRGVFDRWLAADYEIAQARAVNESLGLISGLFGDAALEERVKTYIAKAATTARERVFKRLDRQHRRMETQAYREAYAQAKQEAVAKLEQKPVYGLLKYLADNGIRLYVGAYDYEGAPVIDEESFDSLPMSADEFASLQNEISYGINIVENKDAIIQELLRKKPIKPTSLLEFIRKNGGIKDDGGELKAIGVPKGVATKKGMSPDYMREAALEAGYLPRNNESGPSESVIQDLYDAIEREISGQDVYSEGDQELADAYEAYKQMESYADELGITQKDIDHARAEATKYGRYAEFITTDRNAENAIELDVFAEMNGFTSGQALIKSMRETPSINRESARLAMMAMKQTYGDMLEDGSIRSIARSDLYNADALAALELLASEAAKRATVKTTNMKGFARALAEGIVAKTSVGQLSKASRFDAAREKAQRDALVAAKKGDWVSSVKALQQAMVSHEIYRLSADFAHDLEGFKRLVSKINRKDAKLPKSWHPDFVYAARAVLSRFGLSTTAFNYAKWIADLQENDKDTLSALSTLGFDSGFLSGDKKFNDLTYNDFVALTDMIQNLIHVGRINKEITLGDKRLSVEEGNKAITQALAAKNDAGGYVAEALGTELGAWQTTKDRAKRFFASNTRAEAFARWIDNEDVNGPMTRLVVRPVMDAANASESDRAEAFNKLHALIKDKIGLYEGKRIAAPQLANTSFSGVFTDKWNLIAAVLNAGTKGNMTKLLRGYGWSYEAFMQVVDQNLTQEDMDFVQSIWDFLESDIKPYVTKEYRNRTGLALKEVEARPFVFKGKEYRGGYYPLEPDRTAGRSAEATLTLGEDEILGERHGRPFYPSADTGASKERTGAIYPLSLNISTLAQHVDDAIHAYHVGPAIYQAARVINYRKTDDFGRSFRPFAEEAKNQNVYFAEIWNAWLHAVAHNTMADVGQSDILSRLADLARRRMTVAYIGWNLGTAIQNYSGYAPLVDELNMATWNGGKRTHDGVVRLLKSLASYIASPRQTRKMVEGLSKEMESRFLKKDMDSRKALSDIAQGRGKAGKMASWARLHANFFDNITDQHVSIPAWLAAYQKAIDGGAAQTDAVYFADRVVRTSVMGADVKDTSQIQRGHVLWRMINAMSSYSNMIWNRNNLRLRQLKSGDISVPEFAASYALNVLIPTAAAAGLLSLVGFAPDDEDDKRSWFYRRMISGVFGNLPVVRDIVPSAMAVATGQGQGQGLNNPLYGVAERAMGAGLNVVKALYALANEDEVNWDKAVSGAMTATGIAFNVPTNAPARMFGSIADWIEGDTEPSTPQEAVRDIISGPRKE